MVETLTPVPVLLFRYSALDLDGHRIHYDLPYAGEVEGYPGLVVHGPLVATLLMRACARSRPQRLERVSYRGLSPSFAGRPLALALTEEPGELRAHAASEGRAVMSAAARFRS